MTFDLGQFRAGRFSVPGSSRVELPPGGGRCLYLAADAAAVCSCDASFYFCTYSWLDKLTGITAPCLNEL